MTKSTLHITYGGHATFLIEAQGLHFLTDPNFSRQQWVFFKRREGPGIAADQLPPLSAILVSNALYDHLDLFSYKYFKTTIPIIVPKGIGKFVRKFLPHPVTEIRPGGHHQHFEVKISAVPVKHHGYRILPLRYRAANGYVLETPRGTVYFPGMTAYGEQFKETGSNFKIDTALLPVRPTPAQKSKAKGGPLTPAQALQAARELGAQHLIPYRLDTFNLKRKAGPDPLKELQTMAQEEGLPLQVHVLSPGQSFSPAPLSPVADPSPPRLSLAGE